MKNYVCPLCPFEYQGEEGCVSPEIMDHFKSRHPAEHKAAEDKMNALLENNGA